ncbi:ATP nucleotide 3'-pyrophosphokinase [Streptomyces racemochromogenes]|uniref:ATP nucleotide 3'-pyrophosphokinase n=1 Tax=Streptomyces racemochromogenes TaxID=67353 RepID=A0ABW7PB28_9ACTN
MTPTTGRSPVVKAVLAAALTMAVASAAGPASAAGDDDWKGAGGLTLSSADNATVDAYLDRARQAEKSISTDVRAAAQITGAELIGFDQRLKSPDSLKRKVATSLKDNPAQDVDTVLGRLTDAVRYTLQWPDGRYTTGVTQASAVLAAWGNDNTKWSNTWGRTSGYKGLNTGWRATRSGQLYEIQFHTPASKHAQEATHLLYEEQRLPSTSPGRKKELQARQDALFNAVPVPDGADRLTAPERTTVPAPAIP